MKKRLSTLIGLCFLFSLFAYAAQLPNKRATGVHTFASQSKLAQDRWVRIAVDHTGVYQLRDADLRRMGFSDPAKVGVYGFGGYMLSESFKENHLDDLPEVAVWRDQANQRILFYARGTTEWTLESNGRFAHRNNPYATRGYYFLRQKGDAARMLQPIANSQGGEVVTQANAYSVYEKDEVNLGNTGREMYGESFLYTNVQDFQLDTRGITSAADNAQLEINFVASAHTTGAMLKVRMDDLEGPSKSVPGIGSDKYQTAREVAIYDKFTHQGDWLSVFLQLAKNNVLFNEARLDYIRLNYQRKLNSTDFFYSFRSSQAVDKLLTYQFEVSGTPQHLQVWDVTHPVDIQNQQVGSSNGKLAFTPQQKGLREYVLINTTSVFPSPEKVEDVRAQNLHALPQTDMVILVQPELMPQAKRLAQYRSEKDQLHITIVTPQQIYNEFSSGTPDATAYRLFMKMFYDRATSEDDQPKYLLLFGDGANDNRGLNSGVWRPSILRNCLLTYQSEPSLNETSSYVCDDYFGFLDDHEGGKLDYQGQLTLRDDVLDLGIGRLPVRTLLEARQVVDKIIQYSDNKVLGDWKNQLCFLGDDGDYNTHMRHAERMIEILEEDDHLEFNFNKIYLDAYKREMTASGNSYPVARKLFLDQLNQGAMLVNYSGHGSTTSITHEKLFLLSDAETLSMRRLPVWVTATCDFSRFDHANTSAGEALLLNPQGGGIALFTTTRVVYSDGNLRINSHLIDNLFSKNSDGTRMTLGDVMKYSKRALGADINKLNFVLLGDPSMKMAYPEYRMRVTAVNGKPVGEEPILMKALSRVEIEGDVLALGGDSRATDFTGLVYSTVFDSEEQITSLDNDNTGNPMVFDSRNRRLFSGCDSIQEGAFKFSFIVPKDISYSNESGMINLYAHDEKGREAQGYFDEFLVGGTSDEILQDTIGPRITALYLNNDRFQEGDAVHATPFLLASLEDETGINATGSAIGHDLAATIVKSTGETFRYVLNDYFQTQAGVSSNGTIRFSIPYLEEGDYQLQLKAWDLLNNSSVRTIPFQVKHSVKPVIFDLRAKVNPVRDQAEFLLSHDKPESKLRVRIQVYTQMGQCVWEDERIGSSEYLQDLPLIWDLYNFSGTRVPQGIYIYRAAISCDGEHYATESKKLVVLPQ